MQLHARQSPSAASALAFWKTPGVWINVLKDTGSSLFTASRTKTQINLLYLLSRTISSAISRERATIVGSELNGAIGCNSKLTINPPAVSTRSLIGARSQTSCLIFSGLLSWTIAAGPFPLSNQQASPLWGGEKLSPEPHLETISDELQVDSSA